jgi:hypothetical protein
MKQRTSLAPTNIYKVFRACHPERSEVSAFSSSRALHSFTPREEAWLQHGAPQTSPKQRLSPAQRLLKFVERTTHKAYDVPVQRPIRRTLGRATNPSTRPACDCMAARNPLWLVVVGGRQLFVIPTGGSTMFVEPEWRDLSSTPPQATPWLEAGVLGGTSFAVCVAKSYSCSKYHDVNLISARDGDKNTWPKGRCFRD